MNKQEIRELAKSKGLNVVEETMKINESGVDFQAAHVEDTNGDKWILRIPRRADSMAKANQEKAVLDVVNQYTKIQAPDWKIFTNELIAYKQLEGIPAGTADPEIQNYVWELDIENVPEAFHQSFGRILAELHQVPLSYVEDSGIVIHTAKEARESMKTRMNKVKEAYNVREELWDCWQAWVENNAMWPKHTGLSHGDVHPGHTLINQQSEVTGLIDWTEVAVTDVSRDFCGHYLIFGEEGLEKAITAYEKAGGKTWPLMKEHIIELYEIYPISIAEFAESSGLEEYKEMARQLLEVAEQ